MMAMLLVAAFFSALFLSFILTPLGTRAAWAVGFLDHPEARKLHTAATTSLGGAVVFVSALSAWFLVYSLLGHAEVREAVILLTGALIALGLGLWDDRFRMNPILNLIGQSVAAV